MMVRTTDLDGALEPSGPLDVRMGLVGAAPPMTPLGVSRLAIPSLMIELDANAISWPPEFCKNSAPEPFKGSGPISLQEIGTTARPKASSLARRPGSDQAFCQPSLSDGGKA